METIQEVLQNVHVEYEKNTDYPEASSEDFVVRLAYANRGIATWEKEARDNVQWPELKEDGEVAANGTGLDSLPDNFFSFIRADEHPAVISDGKTQWLEVRMGEGRRMKQDNLSPNVFWIEAGKIRTLPAISGTIYFPYIRKATRYSTGVETDALDVDPEYLLEYVLGKLYLDDKNFNIAQVHFDNAKDILDSKKYQLITGTPSESSFGIGM